MRTLLISFYRYGHFEIRSCVCATVFALSHSFLLKNANRQTFKISCQKLERVWLYWMYKTTSSCQWETVVMYAHSMANVTFAWRIVIVVNSLLLFVSSSSFRRISKLTARNDLRTIGIRAIQIEYDTERDSNGIWARFPWLQRKIFHLVVVVVFLLFD